MKRIRDALKACGAAAQAIDAHRSLEEALGLMAGGVRALLVTDDGRLAGLLSDREILDALVTAGPHAAGTMPVHTVMTSDPCRIDIHADVVAGVRLLESVGAGYLIAMDGETVAGVLPGIGLALAWGRRLEAELEEMNQYLSDLHDAGID